MAPHWPARTAVLAACIAAFAVVPAAAGATVIFNSGTTDGKMAMASRPSGGALEIEAADDFELTAPAQIKGATFTGLLAGSTSVQAVDVEIYRVFPQDSNATRTPNVPTRANSPSDIAFASASPAFTTTLISPSFSTLNSVLNGIHPKPGQTTGGDGPVSGNEEVFTTTLATPIALSAGHYFFVPQVSVASGQFYWLSAPKPIVAPGTPFADDLQAWIRDGNLDPDWLRVGTDIVGSGAFNGTFSLDACDAIAVAGGGPPATAGQPYAAAFTAAGGTAPYTFTASAGLPPGLAITPDGHVVGTPTQAGSFSFVVTAADGQRCTGTRQVALDVAPAAAGTLPPRPHCSIALRSRKVRLHGPRRVRGRLTVNARCDAGARVRVTGRIRERLHGRTTRPRLRGVTAQLAANVSRRLFLRLPRGAIAGLRRHARESASLRLVATAPGGTGIATAAPARLTVKRH